MPPALRALPIGVTLGLTLGACAPDPSSTDAPADLASVVVPDPDFTFETRSLVTVRLEPNAVSLAAPVKVLDAQGRLLFRGVVQQPLELDLRLTQGVEPTLTVISGTGASESTQTVRVADGVAVASL